MAKGSVHSVGGSEGQQSWTPQQQQRWRSDTRWRVAILVGAGIMVVAGLVVGLTVSVRDHPGKQVNWLVILGIGLGMLALFAVSGFIGLRLRARSVGIRRLVVSGDRKDRARVAKMMRQGKDVPAQDMEVAAAISAQVRSARWAPWVLTGICVLEVFLGIASLLDPNSSSNHNAFLLVLRIVPTVLFLLLAGYLWWLRRRLLTWAARHPTVGEEVGTAR